MSSQRPGDRLLRDLMKSSIQLSVLPSRRTGRDRIGDGSYQRFGPLMANLLTEDKFVKPVCGDDMERPGCPGADFTLIVRQRCHHLDDLSFA